MVWLSEEQVAFYRDNGYIQLSAVLSNEDLDIISQEYDQLFRRKNQKQLESSWVGDDRADVDRVGDTDLTVKGIHNLQYHHAAFNRFLFNPRLLDALQQLMGTENIALHHNKAHLKPPRQGAAYPMHQDYPYFPYEKDSLVAAFLHLDAATTENGGLCVYPGSHRLGPLEDVGARETGGNYHYVDQSRFPLSGATPVPAARGDVVIFSYLLVHGSPANLSPRPRRMLLAQVMAADDLPLGSQPARPGQGWLLRGANVRRDASIAKRFHH